MKNKSMNNKGFSLIEVIVAVLIIAIIGSVAVVSFNAVWSTKTESAAKKLADTMKVARTKAMALENKTVSLSGAPTTSDVYVKIYTANSLLNADVCTGYYKEETDEHGVTTSKRDENPIHQRELGSDGLSVEVYDTSENKIGTVGSDVVKIYFKKETGGIAAVEVKGDTSETYYDVGILKVKNVTEDFRDLIMVALTGRCYIDRTE